MGQSVRNIERKSRLQFPDFVKTKQAIVINKGLKNNSILDSLIINELISLNLIN